MQENKIMINQPHENRNYQYDKNTTHEENQNITNKRTQDKTSQGNQHTTIPDHHVAAVHNKLIWPGQFKPNILWSSKANFSSNINKKRGKKEKKQMEKKKKSPRRTLPTFKLPVEVQKVTDGKNWAKF